MDFIEPNFNLFILSTMLLKLLPLNLYSGTVSNQKRRCVSSDVNKTNNNQSKRLGQLLTVNSAQ